jgi:hypothetical protein
MMFPLKKLPFFLPLILIFPQQSFSQPVGQTSFESSPDETVFTQAKWTSEGFTVPWVNGFDQNRAHYDDAFSHSGSKSLRIFFPQGQYGPSNSGAQAPLMVTPANQYYISYWLRFSDNFSWGNTSEGGKLPGLAGGGRCSGCATCTGTNGFSARLMWRTGGQAVLYLYHMDKAGSCGDNLNLQITPGVNFAFQKGQWYNIIERVKINTGNNYDGEVELWVNQQHALLVTGIRFVNNGDKVDNLYFSTFHGGSTAAWAPVVDSYIWFDDIIISANSSDVFPVMPVSGENKFSFKKSYDSKTIILKPHPLRSGNSFFLEAPNIQNNIIKFEWISTSGHLRKEENFVVAMNEFQVPALGKGLYILKIYTEEEVLHTKVIIE